MEHQKTSNRQFSLRLTPFRLVVGIGLVSIGLLAGILAMLILYSVPQTSPMAEIRLVERATTDQDVSEIESTSPSESIRAFREVARTTVHSVVSVSIESSWHSYLWSSSDSDEARESEGSGVIITPQGHIVTNYHLIENASKVDVLFADRREYEAYTVGVDRSTDLAVIQIVLSPEETVQPITIGDAETIQLGDWVLAVGNPLQLNSTVTAGIVSAIGRSMNIIESDFGVENFIQTDAAINPGNSGGALVNIHGELIGINTAIVTNSGFYEGYGFAIPANLVIRVASDLIEFGEFRRSYMGVTPADINAKLARALGMTNVQGVFLDQVYEGGAAENAGLRPGDVIIEVDGQPVNKSNQLQSLILLKNPYSSLEITYWREGKVDRLQLTLLGRDHPDVASWLIDMGYRPQREVLAARYLDQWGLVIRDKTEDDEAQYGELKGIIIQRVVREEEIEYLHEGVLVEQINGRTIHSVLEAVQELENTSEVARLSIRDRENLMRMVTLPM